MNMDFDIPDISENAGKAAGGGKHRKPRRAGKIRLGDSLRSISREYTATREGWMRISTLNFIPSRKVRNIFPFTAWRYPSSVCASGIRKPQPFTWSFLWTKGRI